MQTEINLNYYNNASNKYKSNYILGINKNSGRLQLFPKLRCCNAIYLLLMIMIISIVIILLSSMEIIMSNAIYEYDYCKMNNYTLNIKNPRCVPIEYGNMENFDIEQKELLKDVRTSFIPSDQIIIPPECFKNGNSDNNIRIDEINNRNRRFLKDKLQQDSNYDTHNINKKKTDKEFSLKRDESNDSAGETLNFNENNNNENNNNENCCNDNDFLDYYSKQKKTPKSEHPRDAQFGINSKELTRTEIKLITKNLDRKRKQDEEREHQRRIDVINKTNKEFKLEHDQYYNNLKEFNSTPQQQEKVLTKLNANTFFSTGTKDYIRNLQAETMKKYMDLSVDPCVDFYAFSCGNWGKINPIPQDKAGYDTFEILRENLDSVLESLLTEKDEVNCFKVIEKFSPLTELRLENFKNLNKEQQNVKYKLLNRFKRQVHIYRKRRQLSETFHRKKRQDTQCYNQNTNRPENAEIKAKNLYFSCMNAELLDIKGADPLFDLLSSLGGWPIIEANWSDKNFDWLNLTAQLRLYNNDILIVQWVGPDIKNSDENIMQLDQTNLGLPTRDYYLHESNRKYLIAYQDFMIEIIKLLGVEPEKAIVASEEIIEFETQLANITEPAEVRVNISNLYKRIKITELCSAIPEIDWQLYLSVVQNRIVDVEEEIVIYAINYMQNLVKLLENTESRTVANYLMWRFSRHRINNLDNRFQNAKQKFFFSLFGREKNPPRWKNCVGQVNSNMGMALGAMFVRKYFDENSKQDTLKMTHDIQESFHKIIKQTDWLDPITKSLAEEKVNKMSLKIGYPDLILNPHELDKKYAGLVIEPNEYFENTLRVLRYVTEIEQKKIGEPVNKTIWQTAPAIVNAYYSRNKNQIMFPAGILQPPFYHHYFPRSLNYGGIGVVIGHELTHGFDDKGRLFDSNGNICKWWSDYAINSFHERARCLVSQYGNYTIDEIGMAIDGESTQGENIADNGGINQAFRAYQNWLTENQYDENLEENETLPGLNITNKQLFFLNFAQVWCGSFRPEASKNKIKTAVHAPGKFRVIGTVSNSLDFAREFNCKLGAPMNPEKKCKVW